MTAEQLLTLPDDGKRYELVRGQLRMMTPAGYEHGRIVFAIAAAIHQHVIRHDLGTMLAAETGFRLQRDPDTVRAPDIAFIAKHRAPEPGRQHKFAELAPDLVVEVLSPDDRIRDIEEKIEDYLAAGTRLIWIVDPSARTVTEYRPNTPARVRMASEPLTGYDVLPGFNCTVESLF